tara:strand:+ start:24094 stop:33870 length:9777 start_codon:yes stop_codon:yes gene_type:complete
MSAFPTKVSAFLRPVGSPPGVAHVIPDDSSVYIDATNLASIDQGDPSWIFACDTNGYSGTGYMTKLAQAGVENNAAVMWYDVQAESPGLVYIDLRLARNGSATTVTVYLDDDEVDSFVISDAVSYTYEWFGTSFVIPDEKVHKLGIKVEDTGSVSLDAMRLAFGAEPTLNASFDATDTEQFRDAPYITLHALVYEVNSNLLFDDVNDALPIYSIIKSSDIKADDWYNFDLSPLPWRSPLTVEDKTYVFTLWHTVDLDNHYIIWDLASEQDDPYAEFFFKTLLYTHNSGGDLELENTRDLAIRVWEFRDALDSSACVLTTPDSDEFTFRQQTFDDAIIEPIFRNTSITNEEEDSNEVQLDLPDRIVTLLVDQSGSMTWNDSGGLRHDLARRLVNRLDATYPGDVYFNIFSFESTPIRVNFFAVIESDDVNTNDTSDVADSYFADQESGYAGIRVVRKASSYPLNPLDGDIVTEGFIDRAFDDNLEENEDYFYKVYTFNEFGTFSEGVEIQATPRVREIPNGVGQFSATMLKGTGVRRESNAVMLMHMDEGIQTTTYDFSDNELHGSYFGADEPLWLNPSDVPNGRSGLRFNGSTQGIYVPDASNKTSIDGSMTISMWIYPFDTETSSGVQTLAIRDNSGSSTGSALNIDWWLFQTGASIAFTRDISSIAVSAPSLEADTWNHVAVVYDGNDETANIYINGINRSVATTATKFGALHNPNTSDTLRIGYGKFSSVVYAFFGKMTEVSLLDRELTASEIMDNSFLPMNDSEKVLDNGDRLLLLNYSVPNDYNYAGGNIRIVKKEEAGARQYSFTGNTDDNGELERIDEGFGFEPFHENDGTVVFNESAAVGAFTVAIPDDYIHGRVYDYRIFSQNLIGNYSTYSDSPNLSIVVPGFGGNQGQDLRTDIIGAPSPALPTVDGVSVQQGNRKLYIQWQVPFIDDRVREVHIYYRTGNFPVVDETSSTGELVFRGNPEQLEFVHRNINNDQIAYYAIVTVDQYGFFSSPVYVSQIPDEEADETGIPLLEVQKLRYEVVNEDSVSLQWEQPVRFQKSVEAWFDQRVAMYAQITDEFGAPIADDSRIEIVADGRVSSAQLAEDVFQEIPNRERFTPAAEDTFILSSTALGGGTIRAILRMVPDFNIISAINELNLSAFVSFTIPDRERPSQNIFEFKSLPISIKMKNPFFMEMTNLRNDKIEHLCKETFPLGDITAIATGGLLFNPNQTKEFDGTFIRRQEPFIARVKVKYRDEALDSGGRVFVAVHEASDPGCDDNESDPSVPFEPSFSNRKSRTVLPPSTTLTMQTGTEVDDDGITRTFSFVDIPLQPPDFPQGVMLFAKGAYNGYFSRKRLYIAFENILRVEVTATPPQPDCIDVAEQFASCYLIDPDSPNPRDPRRTLIPDGEICKWTLRKGQTGKDRPFYSTDNVAQGPGVFSSIRNNQARKVFFGPACGVTWTIVNLGPQNGGIALLPEIYALKASVVYDGLSAFEDRPLFIYPQEVTGGFGSRFLMNLDNYRVTMWADGFDYEKLTIWHDPNTAGGWAARGFRRCSEEFGGTLFVLNGGQFVELETGNSFEIFYGDDVEIEFDPYIDEPVISGGTQDVGFAVIPLTELDNKTEVFLRINQFIGPPPDQSDSEEVTNRCGALNLPEPMRTEDNDNTLFGRTEVVFNDELRYLTAGGDLENGIPPTILKLREPLQIRILQARRNGVPVQEILVDGTSEHEFIVEVTFSGKNVPNGTPIFLTIGGPNPQKLQLTQSVIFTQQQEDPFLGGGVRSLASFTTLPFSPLEQFVAQVQAECRYDKRGDVTRSMTSCLTIDYKIEQDTQDNDDDEEEQQAQINNVFSGQIEIYDTQTDTWELKDVSMNHPRGSLTLNWTFDAYGEVLHAIGGIDGTAITAYNEQYRIDSGEWIDLAPMITPRFYHSAVEEQGLIYVLGGLTIEDNDLIVSRALERYNPLTDSWTVLTQMPDLGDGADDFYGIALGAAVRVDNQIYVIGGIKEVDSRGGINALSSRILVYDIDLDTWSASSPLEGSDLVLYSRIAPTAFYDEDNDLIRVIGGASVVGTGQNQTLEFITDSFAIDPSHLSIVRDDSSYQDIPVPRYKANSVTVDGEHYVLGGANKKSNTLKAFERLTYNPLNDVFTLTELAEMTYGRQAFGMATDDLRYIYIAGGITSGRPPGFLQINAEATPSTLRLDGRQSAGIDIELINDVGEHPDEDIRVLVRGFLIFADDADSDNADDLQGGGSGSDQGQQGSDVNRSALIYPVQFSSNDFIISNGFGTTTLLARSEDILDKVDEIKNKLELARQGEDTDSAEQNEPLIINEGDRRDPYSIRIQITVIDDFYYGQTVVDISDNEDPDELPDDTGDDDTNDDTTDDTDNGTDDGPPTAEEDPYSPEFEGCRSYSVTSELPDPPDGGNDDDDDTGDGSTGGGGIPTDDLDDRDNPIFDLNPTQSPQLESPNVNFYSDIEWIPQVIPHISNNLGTAEEMRTVIRRLETSIPFGASPFYDGIVEISRILLDENLDPFAKVIYAQTDNEESLSFVGLEESIEEVQAIDGFAQVPVLLNNFSVVFPTTLSALLARTDTDSLETLAQDTGGQSQTILDAEFANEVLNNMIGRAAGSVGWGTYEAVLDLGQESVINNISVDFTLFDNTDGNWTVEASSDGFNYTEPSDQFDGNKEVEFFRLNGRYFRFKVTLLSGLSASVAEEYDLVATPGRPSLTGINVVYSLPKESYLYITPDTSLFGAQQIAASIHATNPQSSEIQVGVATSNSTSWEDFQTGSRPSINRYGKLFIPIRTEQDITELNEPLVDIDGFSWRATYGRWDPESQITIRSIPEVGDPLTIVEPEEYRLYPRQGLVVFRTKRKDASFFIEVENTDQVRIGLKIVNRFAGENILIRGLGYMWNTNVFLPPPLSERPPSASDLLIVPNNPFIYSKISASYRFTDLNRDEEDLTQTQIRWYVNGVEVEFLRDLTEWNDINNFEDPLWVYGFSFRPEDVPDGVSFEQFARERGDSLLSVGDVIYFTVRPSDGKVFGDLVRSASVEVQSAPPFVTELRIVGRNNNGQEQETVTTATTAVAKFNFFDDGGENASTIIWYVNGTEFKRGDLDGTTSGFSNNEIVPGELAGVGLNALVIGNVLAVEIRPAAGNTAGEPIRSGSVTVENAPPVVTDPQITPLEPTAASVLEIDYTFFDNDIEQGSTTQSDQSSIRWFRKRGTEETFTEVTEVANNETISANFTLSGDQWYAEVIPFDGISVGTTARSNTVTIS